MIFSYFCPSRGESYYMRKLAVAFLLCFCFVSQAQQPNRVELEKRRQYILKTIAQAEEQLASTQKDTRATMGQLRALQTQLNSRQRLINTINQEIHHISGSINRSNKEIERLKSNLDVLKTRYAQSIRYAYKSRSSYDMLAFLFSSDDFNEAVRRLKYLKRYRDYRKDQATQIKKTQLQLLNEIASLNTEKATKDKLLVTEQKQKAAIEGDRNKTNAVVQELKGREKELVATIRKNQRKAEEIDKAVAEIIRKEMELARKKAEEERKRREAEEKRRLEEERKKQLAAAEKKKAEEGDNSNVVVKLETPKPIQAKPAEIQYNYGLTPRAAALSKNFESNQGKLPWPVEKGFISLGFGRYKHPIADKVTLENYGVDIRTNRGANVRACFEGTVSKVFTMDGETWNVLINHGKYFTLYKNLEKVVVESDQKVSTKQTLGTVATNDDGEAVINFQIWVSGTKVDPELWIAH